MPKQGEGHDLGPGGTPGPREVRPSPELAPLSRGESQSRKNVRGEGKRCRDQEVQREMGWEPPSQARSALSNPCGTMACRSTS